MAKLDMSDRDRWHMAINRMTDGRRGDKDWPHFMYEAKDASGEVGRLAGLFLAEKGGRLPQTHQQCSRQAPEPIAGGNRLVCCLGIECASCPYLQALDSIDSSPEKVAEMKAWTCVAHILSNGGDTAGEGYVLTTSDRMYWDRVYESLAQSPEEPDDDEGFDSLGPIL